MKIVKVTIVIFCLNFIYTNCIAQKAVNQLFQFNPQFDGHNIILNQYYYLNENDSLKFSQIKFYISGIELLNNDKVVWKEKNSFHLIDLSNSNSLFTELKLPKKLLFQKIKFNLGIDSITNVSGLLGADLDPMKGMYWTWQSGYINCKIEGESNLCKTKKNEFAFHLGGYQFPWKSYQQISLECEPFNDYMVNIELANWFKLFELEKLNQIMSPNVDAIKLSENLSKQFRIVQYEK